MAELSSLTRVHKRAYKRKRPLSAVFFRIIGRNIAPAHGDGAGRVWRGLAVTPFGQQQLRDPGIHVAIRRGLERGSFNLRLRAREHGSILLCEVLLVEFPRFGIAELPIERMVISAALLQPLQGYASI